MNQDIDLLAAVPSERQHFPSGIHAGIAVLLVLVATIAWSSWLSGRLEAAEQDVRALNDAIDDIVFNLEERSEFLVDRNADPGLLEEIAERERELQDKRRVLNLLSGETLGNTHGFAEQLAALGRTHSEGLWLQRIELEDGGRRLALQGRALAAELVPEFLDALEGEVAFNGVAFNRVTVRSVTDEPGVRFVLANVCMSSESDQSGSNPAAGDDDCTSEEPVRLTSISEQESSG